MKLSIGSIEFDFKPVIAMVYVLIGGSLILLTFLVGSMGWWNVPYALATVLYLSTAESMWKLISR